MKIVQYLCLMILAISTMSFQTTLWDAAYQKILLDNLSHEISDFCNYPSTEYPNTDYLEIVKCYPEDKILIFGYGSLMDPEIAMDSVCLKAVQSMRPALGFGLKRLFNYKVDNSGMEYWRLSGPEKGFSMLNIEPTTTYSHMINGVLMEVTAKDLQGMIHTEVGYDLVPILVADWSDVISKNVNVKIQIAYTFYVPDELRHGIDYTQTSYYPVCGYLHAVQKAAKVYGQDFLDFWNATTYLGNGTTSILKWNEEVFSGILDTAEPL